MLKHCGVNITEDDMDMEGSILDGMDKKKVITAEELMVLGSDFENRLLGVAFLMCADHHR
jgi:hypothetical protein